MRFTLLFITLALLFSCNITEEEINSIYEGKVKVKDPWADKKFPKDGIGTQWETSSVGASLKIDKPYKYPKIEIFERKDGLVKKVEKPELIHESKNGHTPLYVDVKKIVTNKQTVPGPGGGKVSKILNYTVYYSIPRHADRTNITGNSMPHDLGYIAPVVLRKSAKEYYMWFTKVQKIYDTTPDQNNLLNNFHYSYSIECRKSINGGKDWTNEITFNNGLKRAAEKLPGGLILFDILEDNGSYLLWYLGKKTKSDKEAGWRLYSATWSDSLTRWIVDAGTDPFLLKDIEAVGFDTHSVSKGSGFFDPVDSVYKLWYGGSNGEDERIGLALSSNGEVSAVKEREPAIFNGKVNMFDSQAVTDPYIMKDGEIYRMWYSGYDGTNWKIGLAYSWDGVTFTYSNDNYSAVIPDLKQNQKADYRYPCVIKEGDKYIMWYSKREPGSDVWSIEMATSNVVTK